MGQGQNKQSAPTVENPEITQGQFDNVPLSQSGGEGLSDDEEYVGTDADTFDRQYYNARASGTSKIFNRPNQIDEHDTPEMFDNVRKRISMQHEPFGLEPGIIGPFNIGESQYLYVYRNSMFAAFIRMMMCADETCRRACIALSAEHSALLMEEDAIEDEMEEKEQQEIARQKAEEMEEERRKRNEQIQQLQAVGKFDEVNNIAAAAVPSSSALASSTITKRTTPGGNIIIDVENIDVESGDGGGSGGMSDNPKKNNNGEGGGNETDEGEDSEEEEGGWVIGDEYLPMKNHNLTIGRDAVLPIAEGDMEPQLPFSPMVSPTKLISECTRDDFYLVHIHMHHIYRCFVTIRGFDASVFHLVRQAVLKSKVNANPNVVGNAGIPGDDRNIGDDDPIPIGESGRFTLTRKEAVELGRALDNAVQPYMDTQAVDERTLIQANNLVELVLESRDSKLLPAAMIAAAKTLDRSLQHLQTLKQGLFETPMPAQNTVIAESNVGDQFHEH
jgi:hypothetical protein